MPRTLTRKKISRAANYGSGSAQEKGQAKSARTQNGDETAVDAAGDTSQLTNADTEAADAGHGHIHESTVKQADVHVTFPAAHELLQGESPAYGASQLDLDLARGVAADMAPAQDLSCATQSQDLFIVEEADHARVRGSQLAEHTPDAPVDVVVEGTSRSDHSSSVEVEQGAAASASAADHGEELDDGCSDDQRGDGTQGDLQATTMTMPRSPLSRAKQIAHKAQETKRKKRETKLRALAKARRVRETQHRQHVGV
ncbi:hypothetical protein K437DRAFT_120549 [Tilletiaria anomala UBC 951]|uniref:Uncharacterized protein n=1 Tax=Tilletiaria anomala (strain ATCC 24038 / CBS 436.72 / UBC 951) TaxID=1037660 RepID=A0A066VV32_TILAU|nr:uncharacterized protein K437DRAFT_120549 [Tilletiaria anomala UBC 951]KDN45592.1 hypothetical protein K437DRAFT_120549 [Tilletiaria anomala UBC 951]